MSMFDDIAMELATKLSEPLKLLQRVQLLERQLDYRDFLLGKRDDQMRRLDTTIGELHVTNDQLREELTRVRVRCSNLERGRVDLAVCWWCRKPRPAGTDSIWSVAGRMYFCSATCFRKAHRHIFSNYVWVQRETRAWQDARNYLTKIRRFLKVARPRASCGSSASSPTGPIEQTPR